jgi:uncharacterized protein (DUF1800 family)
MAINTSLSPISSRDFDRAAARHLMLRVGWGGTPGEIAKFAEQGLDAAVDRLVDYQTVDVSHLPEPEVDADVMRPTTREDRQELLAQADGDREAAKAIGKRLKLKARRADIEMAKGLGKWWLQRMINTPRPAEERLTMLWHGHFASAYRIVRDAYLIHQQHQTLRKHANGSFADLVKAIIRDPAMILYLNNNRNVKRSPNENLARELMELFTLGEGQYTEADIKAGARALTGYHVDDNDFTFRLMAHDDEQKTILGQTARHDGEAFVDLLLEQPACARFIALKLYDFFVADVGDDMNKLPAPARSVIDQLAKLLRKHRYELKPVLTALFKSRHFYDPQIVGQKIKDPLQLLVGSKRSMGLPDRHGKPIEESVKAMGLVPFEPPSVDGWAGGRAWINTSTLFVRQNLLAYLITGKHESDRFDRSKTPYRAELLLDGVGDFSAERQTDHVLDHLVGFHVPAERRAPIHRFVRSRGEKLTNDDIQKTLCLITAMPEYQLC